MLTDPLIEDPVGVTFDGNGRMYVLEMRSYMQDADGTDSRAPISRISRHEDTDGDGIYDKHTVFVDNWCCRGSRSRSATASSSPSRPTTATSTNTPTPTATASPTRKSCSTGRRPRPEHGVAARRA